MPKNWERKEGQQMDTSWSLQVSGKESIQNCWQGPRGLTNPYQYQLGMQWAHSPSTPSAVPLKESENLEEDQTLERTGGPVRSGSDAEAAARAKNSCQDPGGARFSLPVLDPLLFLGLGSAGLWETWCCRVGRRKSREDNGAAEAVGAFGSLSMIWMNSAQLRWPWSSKGNQEFEAQCQSILGLFSFSSHYQPLSPVNTTPFLLSSLKS